MDASFVTSGISEIDVVAFRLVNYDILDIASAVKKNVFEGDCNQLRLQAAAQYFEICIFKLGFLRLAYNGDALFYDNLLRFRFRAKVDVVHVYLAFEVELGTKSIPRINVFDACFGGLLTAYQSNKHANGNDYCQCD